MTDFREDGKLLLESGTADLQKALDELEQDIPPEELEAWLASFKAMDES